MPGSWNAVRNGAPPAGAKPIFVTRGMHGSSPWRHGCGELKCNASMIYPSFGSSSPRIVPNAKAGALWQRSAKLARNKKP
jgi:hypothetical protein